jgi:hypothetical protein
MKKFQDAGFRVAETPVHHYHRAHGHSQFFNFRRVFQTAIDVLKLWWVLVIRREHLKKSAAPAAAAHPTTQTTRGGGPGAPAEKRR